MPSLFPFLCISLFLSLCGAGEAFSILLTPVTKYLLHLPAALGQTILFSLTGGYPTGSRLLASLVEEGNLRREDASVLLGFCVSPGPAFVILAVGEKMFGSMRIGVILLTSQLLSSLLLGAFLCRIHPVRISSPRRMPLSFTQALVQAVSQASSGMLSICAYVVLCAVVSSLLFPKDGGSVFSCIFEVTNGCLAAAEIPGNAGILLASFLLAFGGISVCLQVTAAAAGAEIPLRGFFAARICCGMLSGGITFLMLRIFRQALPAISQAAVPVAASAPNRLLGAVCLCGMIFLTLSNLSGRDHLDF